MELIYLLVGLAVGAAIGFLVAKLRTPKGDNDVATVAALTATTELQNQRITELTDTIALLREKEANRTAEDNAVINKLEPVTLMLKQLGDSVRTMENERGNQYTSVVDALRMTQEKTETLAHRINLDDAEVVDCCREMPFRDRAPWTVAETLGSERQPASLRRRDFVHP